MCSWIVSEKRWLILAKRLFNCKNYKTHYYQTLKKDMKIIIYKFDVI